MFDVPGFFPLGCQCHVHLWPVYLQNQTVKFWYEYQVVLQVVDKLLPRSPMVMHLVRGFTLQCSHFNILFAAQHVLRVQNNRHPISLPGAMTQRAGPRSLQTAEGYARSSVVPWQIEAKHAIEASFEQGMRASYTRYLSEFLKFRVGS